MLIPCGVSVMNICPACNEMNPETASFCTRCGMKRPLVSAAPMNRTGEIPCGYITQNGYSADGRRAYYYQPVPVQSNAFALASFILGVVSFPVSCIGIMIIFFLPVTFISGIVGLVLGLISLKRRSSGMGVAGVVLNIVSIMVVLAVVVFFIVVFGFIMSSSNTTSLQGLGTPV